MKPALRSLTRKGIFTAAMGMAVLAFATCNKTDKEKFGTPYVGTWKGYSTCTGANDIIITKGDDDMSVKVNILFGADSTCLTKKDINGVADENNITFNPQYFTDACNIIWMVNGLGTISQDTLTMSFNIQGTYKGIEVSRTCTYKGYKK